MKNKVKVVLGQLGSPRSTKVSDVREYLKEFLGDPRVVDINPTVWKIILNLFVLPFRPAKSAKLYSRIWDGKSFPLISITESFAQKVSQYVDDNIEIDHAFLLSSPRIDDVFESWESEEFGERADSLMVIPQFPQYAESTTASVFDIFAKSVKSRVNLPNVSFISNHHKLKAFIDQSAEQIDNYITKSEQEGAPVDEFVMSFHGIPLRRVLTKKDEYYRHCFETYQLIVQRVKSIDASKIHLTFQSRFGSEQWLGPATDEFACDLAKAGAKRIAVYCPSFVVDCLETTDEIGNELREELEEHHCDLVFINCLNDSEQWARAYAQMINTLVNGNRQEQQALFYQTEYKEVMSQIPEQKFDVEPLSPKAKSVLKIVFLTLFLDLIGFSIIFPMFPQLAKHYLMVDGDNYFLKLIFGTITDFTGLGGKLGMSPIVLFGGALGALYSLLQFVAAPIWGSISDRIGRKPVLMVSIFGLMLSYILWFFSGSFTLLIIARFIGGVMGGNISTATAVVADITDSKNRSKGMAFIGIAFALGFIFGPAIGGILSLIDLTKIYPSLQSIGVNPFSVPALFAAILSLINLIILARNFDETLDPAHKKSNEAARTSNPLKIFSPLPYKNVNLVNWSYFVFISAFSGMEFTLTFLAVERLAYSPMDNGYMFIYIGFLIALTQGGYVRRKANTIGEKKMGMQGLIAIIPGLVIIAYAHSTLALYAGLFFLSIGSAMIIPNLTSLVSLHSPASEQGRSIGIFRSLGSFGRVVGPILASLAYWKYGSAFPYLVGSASILIPILILAKVDKLEH